MIFFSKKIKRVFIMFLLFFYLFLVEIKSGYSLSGISNLFNYGSNSIKNVILIVGDGFGIASTTFIKDYYELKDSYEVGDKKRHSYLIEFIKKSKISLTSVNPYGNLIVDSASAATSIATGYKTKNNYVGLDSAGNKLSSIIDVFHRNNRDIGIITNASVTHATPASFYANVNHRKKEKEIALQFIKRNDIKVFFGGGLKYFLDSNVDAEIFKNTHSIYKEYKVKGEREDQKNLINELNNKMDGLGKKKVKIVFNRESLLNESIGKNQIIRGIFSNGRLPYEIDRKQDKVLGREVPSLTDMCSKAISILKENKNGFLLVIESGLIDQAEHDTDIGTLLHEMIELDELMGLVMDFVNKNNDTMVVLTADHSTGGLGISYTFQEKEGGLGKTKFYHNKDSFKNLFKKQKISLRALFKKVVKSFDPKGEGVYVDTNLLMSLLNQNFPVNLSLSQVKSIFKIQKNDFISYKSIEKDENIKKFYSKYLNAVFLKYISPILGFTWNSGTHISNMVNTYTYGARVIDRGFIHNTEIYRHIEKSILSDN